MLCVRLWGVCERKGSKERHQHLDVVHSTCPAIRKENGLAFELDVADSLQSQGNNTPKDHFYVLNICIYV